MKKLMILMLSPWCGSAVAQTAQELIDNGKNPENVTTFGMGYNLNQYSPLNQINKSNIKRLVPIWSTSLSNDAGELGAAHGLQRRHVRGERHTGRSRSTSRPASRSGARRSNTTARRRASARPASSCAAAPPSTTASCSASRSTATSSRST